MKVRFKKNNKNAITPTYASPGDACLDLYAASVEEKNNELVIDTGIALEIPDGFVGLRAMNLGSSALTDINIENLNQLVDLRLFGNNLSSIDLSQNSLLNLIFLANNRLISLDVSGLPNLQTLHVQNQIEKGGGLASIDLSNNINLNNIRLNSNLLSSATLDGIINDLNSFGLNDGILFRDD